MISRDVFVTHPGGIHALVAQELASLAHSFASSLYLRHDGRTASAGQPVAVLALGIARGTPVTVFADGIDEAEALSALVGYLAGPTPTPDLRSRTPKDPQ
ncbi:HPr family phosphocarrier protein [Propionicimonas sp.]|uniref:HPr family phosphocarrier protein n=1 Tax=Propionicimonas sp. TaxID=1955623 RepID=UPI0039E5002E